jgi:predicted RNA-binding protein YlxR (DUF448 family)
MSKTAMLRIVFQNQQLLADLQQRLPGRGGYFCGAFECGQRLRKSKFKARPPGNCHDARLWSQFLDMQACGT